jgi:hypothetical protein
MGIQQMLLAVGPVFTPVTRTYTTATTATETIPVGATTVVIECFGATGLGAHGDGSFKGGGGGSGGYSRTSHACSGGQTLSYVVGQAASSGSSVSSGTLAITTMTGPLGGNGSIGSGSSGTGGAAGATGTGGTAANSVGNAGATGGNGGAGVTGVNGSGAPGGNGNITVGTNNPGNDGVIIFSYT